MQEVTRRYIILGVFLAFVAITSWYAMEPPRSRWIFVLTGAAALLYIGITTYKQRAGHFKE